MIYTIKESPRCFKDLESSELIAALTRDEDPDQEIAVEEWPPDIEFYDSAGYSWAKQQKEAGERKTYRVSDIYHSWCMGLVIEVPCHG